MDRLISSFPAFTPLHSLAGGLMLASSVHAMASQLGSPLGISGFFHTSVTSLLGSRKSKSTASEESKEELDKKLSDETALETARLFTAGLLTGGLVLAAGRPTLEAALGVKIFDAPSPVAVASPVVLLFQGLIIGLGTKLGSGCTSGHFLCGLSRLSWRSIVATATFFSVAVATNVYLHPLPANAGAALAASSFVAKAGQAVFGQGVKVSAPVPELWVLAIMQAPAVVYGLIVPRMAAKAPTKASAAEDVKQATLREAEVEARHRHAARITAFTVGLHFAFGLALTGMLRPSKVLGFLTLTPDAIRKGVWDPSLACVAVGGILPSAAGFFLSVKPKMKRAAAGSKKEDEQTAKPGLWAAVPRWRIPTNTNIDARLVGGATLFGLGWGASGLCPGPVLVSFTASLWSAAIGSGTQAALVTLRNFTLFVAALAVGGQLGAAV